MRAALEVVLDLLHQIAAPTGARGSVLLMSGGLIVLGFLFMAFLFRSAIVGDLAPVANARAPTRRALLPPALDPPRLAPARALPRQPFDEGRLAGRDARGSLDAALDHVRSQGVEARVLQSNATWKRVRLYRCVTCQHDVAYEGCEFERGLLAGAFEPLTRELAKVHETSCVGRGDAYCDFDVRHAPLLELEVR